MYPCTNEVRTPERHLLVGEMAKLDGKWVLLVQSRGKQDYIDAEHLVRLMGQYLSQV